jgi:acetyltransferase-like isoleucine patch superfamily enzyme
MGLKVVVYKPILITIKALSFGTNIFIRDFARIEAIYSYQGVKFDPVIQIDDNVSIEQNLHLTCAGKIHLGSNTAIAANVTMTDINHPYQIIDLPPEKQFIEVNAIEIGPDCKIYNNAVILPGTRLGKHCIVGANSVVQGKFYEEYSVIVGAPAKIIKRYSFEQKAWLKTNPNGEFIYNII